MGGHPPPTTWPKPLRSTEGSRMPADHRVLKLTAAVTAAQTATMMLATRALAAPSPSPSPSNNPCDLIHGSARELCEQENSGRSGRGSPIAPDNPLDPLSS